MIYWIHGAFASRKSFSYIHSQLPAHRHEFFEYSTRTPLKETIGRLEVLLREFPAEAVVGHSLGGFMAALMRARGLVDKGACITSPAGGFDAGNFFLGLNMIAPLLGPVGLAWEMRSNAPIFEEIRAHQFDERFLAVVSPKDRVVPLYSQKALKGGKVVEVTANHMEVLLCPDVVEHLDRHLFN